MIICINKFHLLYMIFVILFADKKYRNICELDYKNYLIIQHYNIVLKFHKVH